ncbi:hypothetical protein MG293_004166 [Ovis ammon polii]|uniref:Uncharacterized protein n=1 Tax=Ovis ammon polii TaxID=230172 RepID=A0AAD4UKA7_OVIAM|nr:hypothetical protein MG293_004166 [Ovis ammon polii]
MQSDDVASRREQPVCFLFSDSMETKVSAALMLRDPYATHDIFISCYSPGPVVCLVSARLTQGGPRASEHVDPSGGGGEAGVSGREELVTPKPRTVAFLFSLVFCYHRRSRLPAQESLRFGFQALLR